MDRRRFLAATSIVAFAGYVTGSEPDDGPEFREGQQTTPTETSASMVGDATSGEARFDQSNTRRFTGSGAKVVRDVELADGLTVVTASHDGSSNFIVTFVPSQNDLEGLFVNAIGAYEGTNAELLDGDTYFIDVNADGDWQLEVSQPRPDSGSSLPATIEGDIPNVFGPFEFDGTTVASGTHDGNSNFIVEVLPVEGLFGELMFNEIGRYDGETAFRFDGVGFVDVEADGPYSITIE